MASAKQNQLRNRRWGTRGRIYRWSICHIEDYRSKRAYGEGSNSSGEVCQSFESSFSSGLLILSSLRRRFQQNQEDCTFTVLALLPTATDNIIEALPVETITHDLQQKKAERLGKSAATPSEISSGPPSVTDEDGKSLASFQSESFVHTSQMASSGSGDSSQPKPPKTKVQLWNELKISCEQQLFPCVPQRNLLILPSYHPFLHPPIHTLPPCPSHPHPTEPPRPTELPFKRCLLSFTPTTRPNNQPRKPRRRQRRTNIRQRLRNKSQVPYL